MHDIVIRGGTIIDGTGKSAFTGDVGITGGRIAVPGRFYIPRLFRGRYKGNALDFRAQQGRTGQVIHALELVKRGQRFGRHSQRAYRASARQSVGKLIDENKEGMYV